MVNVFTAEMLLETLKLLRFIVVNEQNRLSAAFAEFAYIAQRKS